MFLHWLRYGVRLSAAIAATWAAALLLPRFHPCTAATAAAAGPMVIFWTISIVFRTQQARKSSSTDSSRLVMGRALHRQQQPQQHQKQRLQLGVLLLLLVVMVVVVVVVMAMMAMTMLC
jgi:hypothetical protein